MRSPTMFSLISGFAFYYLIFVTMRVCDSDPIACFIQ